MSPPPEDRRQAEDPPSVPEQRDGARSEAIKQIERRRRFHIELAVSAIVIVVLVVVWAMNEYHNAGGWPTDGFSQSSGVHHVWNYWIVYPVGVIVVVLVARAWFVYHGHKPISEDEIEREIRHQSGRFQH